MKPALLLFWVAAFAMATSWVHAVSVITEVTSKETQVVGFDFGITAKDLPDGRVEFRVVVSEKEGKFSSRPSTSLSTVVTKDHSSSISSAKALPLEKQGKSMVCVFTVERAALEDPSLCFVFTNPVERMVNGKLMAMPSVDMAFARLKDFGGR